MGTAYFDPASVHRRLHQTICMYKGEPVFVECLYREDRIPEGEEWHKVRISTLPLGESRSRTVDYRSTDFDYRAIPLGYMNAEGGAYYLTRIPGDRNHQKQGLCKYQIHSYPTVQAFNFFASSWLRDCILGVYPTYVEALEELSNGAKSVAVTRCIALKRDKGDRSYLLYRGRQVGSGIDGNNWIITRGRDAKTIHTVINDYFTENKLCLRVQE